MSDAVKLFRTPTGWIVKTADGHFRVPPCDVPALTRARRSRARCWPRGSPRSSLLTPPALDQLLAPIDRQEVWAAGVTYFRSRTARMEESKVVVR